MFPYENARPVQRNDAIPVQVAFCVIRQGRHIMNGFQLLLRQAAGENFRQFCPGGRAEEGDICQGFR